MRVKIKFPISKFFSFFVAIACISNSNAQNLILNGNFNNTTTSWTSFAPANTVEATFFEPTYGGTNTTNRCAEVDGYADLRQSNIPVVAGTAYYLGFKATRRTNIPAPSSGNQPSPNPNKVKLKLYSGTNVFIIDTLVFTNTAWNWQCQVYSFTPTVSTGVTLDYQNVTPTLSTLGSIFDDITITPQIQPIVKTGNDCTGSTVTLTAPASTTTAAYTYSWTGPNGFTATTSAVTFNNAQTSLNGTYTCSMTINGCIQINSTYDLQIVSTHFDRTASICAGDIYTFYGRSLFQSGSYDTTITSNSGGCDSNITLTLTVNSLPDIAIDPSAPVSICEGDSVKFSILHFDPTTNYQWFRDNNPIAGATQESYQFKVEGNYKFVAQNSFGCTNISDEARLTVNPLPIAQISPSDTTICRYNTLSFKAATGASYSYIWEPASVFENNAGSTSQDVTGIFNNEKTTVILNVKNENGCADQDTVIISTTLCCSMFMPNSFSPNNDALNDYIKPEVETGQRIKDFRVFDRYGKTIYSNTNPGKGWDGKYPNGQPAEVGAYFYYITYTCGENNILYKKGDIVLIR